MFKDFQSTLTTFFKKDGDPLGAITPEQLKAVLKSIEGKYNTLRDENRRLKGVVEDQRGEIMALDQAQSRSVTAAEEAEQQRTELGQAQQLAEAIALECQEANRRIENLATEREVLLERISALEPLSERISSLEQERDAALQAKATAIKLADADAEKAALRAQLEELREELAKRSVPAPVAEVKEPVDELWDELWEVRQDRDRVAAERDALKREVEQSLLGYQELRTELDRHDAACQSFQDQIADLGDRTRSEQAVLDLSGQLQEAKEALRAADLERTEAAEAQQIAELKLQAASGQRSELNTQLDAALERAETQQALSQSQASELLALRSRLDQQAHDLGDLAQLRHERELLGLQRSELAVQVEQLTVQLHAERELRKSTAVGAAPARRPEIETRSLRPRVPRKPPSTDDPARKLDRLLGL